MSNAVPRLGLWMVALSLLVLCITVPFAALTSMGNDEIYTFEVARQPHLTTIWSVLKAGADNHPPLDYWIRHLAMSVFGTSSLAFRLPSVIAIWIAAILLFLMLCRRGPPVYGASLVLLMMLSCGQVVAVNDRGYAVLLACFAAALYAWDGLDANDSGSVWLWSIFALSLTAAVYTHYYGVLFFVAFGLTATVRSILDRRLWLKPFLLLAGATFVCLPLRPLAEAAGQYRVNFWTPVNLSSALGFYPALLSPVTPTLVFMAVLVAIFLSYRPEIDGWRSVALSRDAVLAAAMFACLPVVLFVLARLLTGAFWPRYVYSAGVALCTLVVVFGAKLPLGRRARTIIFIGVPLLFLTVATFRLSRGLTFSERREFVNALAQLQRTSALPVVLGDDGLFVEIAYAYPSALRNCFFVYDTHPDRRTNVDLAVRGLQQVMPVQAQTWVAMKTVHPSFLYIGNWGDTVLQRALEDGGTVRPGPPQSATAYWVVSTSGS